MNCLICGQLLKRELSFHQLLQFLPIIFSDICVECEEQLICYQEEVCAGCGRPNSQESLCRDCRRWQGQVSAWMIQNRAILHYNDFLKEWFYRYKYQGDVRLAKVVQEKIRNFYKDHSDACWVILPSSPQNFAQRQFHPVKELLKAADVPFEEVFDYIGNGEKQAEKTRENRLKMRQPFRVKENFDLQASKKYLIFDDVYTTGATLIRGKEALSEHLNIHTLNAEEYQIQSVSLARDVADYG